MVLEEDVVKHPKIPKRNIKIHEKDQKNIPNHVLIQPLPHVGVYLHISRLFSPPLKYRILLLTFLDYRHNLLTTLLFHHDLLFVVSSRIMPLSL